MNGSLAKWYVTSLVIVCVFLMAATVTLARTPMKISYQGRATDASGNPVPDGSYPVQFHLYDHPTAGSDRWWEQYSMVTTSNGLFTHLLGDDTPIPDSLFATYDSLYLQVIFNGIILSPRTPIASVGYALRVNSVDGASGGTISASADTGVYIVNGGSVARVATLSRLESNVSDTMSAIRGVALNTGYGTPQGAHFRSTNTGDGRARGIMSEASNNASYWAATAVLGHASNMGSGYASGATFYADSGGTGEHTGVTGVGYAGSTGTVTKGGGFSATGSSGVLCGVDVDVYSYGGLQGTYGIRSEINASSPYTGVPYAGYFENAVPYGSNAYGVYSYTHGLMNGYSSFGVFGLCEPSGSGSSAAGYFKNDSTGTNTSYGCRGVGYSRASAVAYGITGQAASRGTGAVYGGYFEAFNYGTGAKYGIYAVAPSSGYAGYFSGNIKVTGNQTVDGTKSAAVEVGPDEYRLVYSQESPECWFEDFGKGQLSNGRAHVELDPLFLRTVTIDTEHPMNVFIQPNDPNCKGTAVVCGLTGFDVMELANGSGNAAFTYRVVAKRKGYEDVRFGLAPGPTPRETAAQQEADHLADQEVERTLQQDALRQKQESEKATKQHGQPPE